MAIDNPLINHHHHHQHRHRHDHQFVFLRQHLFESMKIDEIPMCKPLKSPMCDQKSPGKKLALSNPTKTSWLVNILKWIELGKLK